MKKIRLDKYLHELGYGTRTSIKDYIKHNNIYVNNILIKDPGYLVDTDIDIVKDNDHLLAYNKYIYLMLNKPKGYITTTDNLTNSVMVLLKDYENYHIFPIGRLDKDTTGLLLFTNDGMFSHNLLHPKKHIDKTYDIVTLDELPLDKIEELERGLNLANFKTKPALVKTISSNHYLITIHEGQYHQIKRMVEYCGSKVIELKRISIGSLKLDVEEGKIRELTEEEIKKMIS